jgi:hypothetical protein
MQVTSIGQADGPAVRRDALALYYALTCALGAVGLLRLGLSLQTIRTVQSAPASEAVPAEHVAPRPVIGE